MFEVYAHGFSHVNPSDGKVQMDEFSPGAYLKDLVDGVTISDVGGVLVASAAVASPQVITADCDISVVVGDLVYMDDITDNLAVRAPDNRTSVPVAGQVVGKPTAITATILISGFNSYLHFLNPGDMIFVSATGSPTTVRPATGYIQVLGLVIDSGKLYLNPNPQRIPLSPF